MNPARICKQCGKPNARARCGRCGEVYYCNALCQKLDWTDHKLHCDIMGIRVIAAQGVIRGSISCNVRRTPWLLGTVSPISVLVGFPVSLIAKQEHVLGKHIKVSLPMSMADGVQQNPWRWSILSDLMIDPITKESPSEWKKTMEAKVIREDRKTLNLAAFELIATFCSNVVLGHITEISSAVFAQYCVAHKDRVLQRLEPSESRYIRFRDLQLPL